MTSAIEGRDLDGDLAAWLATAPPTYLACREVRHAWPTDPESMQWRSDNYQGRPVWVREWECIHGCGVIRTWRRCRLTGENWGSKYTYPPSPDGNRSNYLLPVGSGVLSSDDIFRYQMAQPQPRRRRKG